MMPEGELTSSGETFDVVTEQAPVGVTCATAVQDQTAVQEHPLPVVAIGGSAGSIGELRKFFSSIAPDTGMAFVVVIHLSPEHESSLAELLQRTTSMPTVQVRDGAALRPNAVFVIPPGKYLTIVDGAIHLTEPTETRGKRTVVDLLFRTLAETHGQNSIAIILSGADGDGAIGIKRVKERGGLTIAQDPGEAEHPDMPRNAIDTGMVDWVLPVSEMGTRILDYSRRASRIQLPPVETAAEGVSTVSEEAPESEESIIRHILDSVKAHTGHEFTYYKRATVLRRIGRRMQVTGVETLAEYLPLVREQAVEASALLKDLLISVTNFFRDPESFAALEAELPRLLENKGPQDVVRVWVAGCATGEEAYSVAMLLCEYAESRPSPPVLQVFATDISGDAIQHARAGIYPETILADVGEARMRRFFTREHGRCRIRPQVREMVLFALHDLLKDAPFCRLDLVCCRNLLIYLNRPAQTRAMDIFHFALRSGGLLLLGSSESMDERSILFGAVEKRHRLYVRQDAPRRSLPMQASSHSIALALSSLQRMGQEHASSSHTKGSRTESGVPDVPEMMAEPSSWGELHFKLLEQFSPPSIVVDARGDIVHVSENASDYLQFQGGQPSMNLLNVVKPKLRVELRTLLFRAAQFRQKVYTRDLYVEVKGEAFVVDLCAVPSPGPGPEYTLVVFIPKEKDGVPTEATNQGESLPVHLEKELEQAKAELRSTIEQFAASTEELQASNEELQAMNEELQSATEELETGREELQAINEELSAANLEVKGKVDELSRANSDLQNLISSTNIATVFLDRELRIQRYTPSSVTIFRFIPTDIGRPFSDLASHLVYPTIVADAQQVLSSLAVVEKEVRTADDLWYLVRLLPYRTGDDHIGGVVLTFVDITNRKKNENAIRDKERFISTVTDSARALIAVADISSRRFVYVNRYIEDLLGHTVEEWTALPWEQLKLMAHENDLPEIALFVEDCRNVRMGARITREFRVRHRNGTWRLVRVIGTPFSMAGPESAGSEILCVVDDFTDYRQTQENLKVHQRDLSDALNETQRTKTAAADAARAHTQSIAVLSHELRTPLTPIFMALPELLEIPNLSEDHRSDLQMIQRNLELEARFIDQLLDYIRLSKGKADIRSVAFDAHETLGHTVKTCEPEIQAKKQRLKVAFEASDHKLIGDPLRLQQAVWNLIKNASKFTAPNGTIELRTTNAENKLIIEVRDDGVGIKPEQLENIFEAFDQGSKEVSQGLGGLGLGLAIARAAVRFMGGDIRARSDGRGKGATFLIEVPLQGRES